MGLVQHGTFQVPGPEDTAMQGIGCAAADDPSVGASRECFDGEFLCIRIRRDWIWCTNLRGPHMSISTMPCALRVFPATVQAFAVNARADCQSARCSVLNRYGWVTSDGDQRCPELCRMYSNRTHRLRPSGLGLELYRKSKGLSGMNSIKVPSVRVRMSRRWRGPPDRKVPGDWETGSALGLVLSLLGLQPR